RSQTNAPFGSHGPFAYRASMNPVLALPSSPRTIYGTTRPGGVVLDVMPTETSDQATLLSLPHIRSRSESCLSSREGDCDTDEPYDHFYSPMKAEDCGLDWTKVFWVWFHRVKIVALVLLLLFAVITMSFFEEEENTWEKFQVTAGNGSHLVKLGNNSEPVHVSLKGPFLSKPLANITNVFTRVALVGFSNETSGDAVILKELFRAPTAPAAAAPALVDSVVQEVINLHEFGARRCRLLVEVDGPPGSSYVMQVQVTPKQEEFGISIPLAFIVLSVLYLLIGFE
ncbi:unnamed protein product, partial [Ixodes persulcatus]